SNGRAPERIESKEIVCTLKPGISLHSVRIDQQEDDGQEKRQAKEVQDGVDDEKRDDERTLLSSRGGNEAQNAIENAIFYHRVSRYETDAASDADADAEAGSP